MADDLPPNVNGGPHGAGRVVAQVVVSILATPAGGRNLVVNANGPLSPTDAIHVLQEAALEVFWSSKQPPPQVQPAPAGIVLPGMRAEGK